MNSCREKENKFVGFEKELNALKCQLLKDDEVRSVIAIVGESGIGKSNLHGKSMTIPTSVVTFTNVFQSTFHRTLEILTSYISSTSAYVLMILMVKSLQPLKKFMLLFLII